ncbi:MAG: S8 family peptidase, partial [Actinobacteria bacterium]|nr:S8 family peptidase [Actinomycetota bacterium]
MLIIEEPDGATIEFRYVDLTNAGSTTNSVFEVGFADPTDSNNTVRIPDSNGDPSASELLSGQFGGSTGIWSYGVGDSGSPSPAPTPTPTPTPINTIQPDPPWGLDRIDQRSLPLDSTFTPAGNGSGVTVYVIDTGINTTHTEYASRVVAGYDFVDNDSDPSDCDGHGTHVAGTAVGSTYGVAKAASVSGVRVLNCYGNGYTSDVVAGMNWVRTNHSSGDAVVNMSLGGGGSKSIDDAVAALTSANITVVVAAGNSNDDAQYYSPARAATAITVGSTTSTDARSSFSNYGSTVDIFAPGSSILSAWYTSNTASNTLNGTSMASPHVAGAAAVYLGLNPGSTPAQVASALTSVSTTDAVTSAGSGSPDRLLYVADFS